MIDLPFSPFLSFSTHGPLHHVLVPPFTGDAAVVNLDRSLQTLIVLSHTDSDNGNNKIIAIEGPSFWLTSVGLDNSQAQGRGASEVFAVDWCKETHSAVQSTHQLLY